MIENENNVLLSPTWKWNKAIPDYIHQCLEYEIQDLDKFTGGTYATPGGPEGFAKEQDLNIRNSDVLMFDPIHWYCGILFNFAMASNIQAAWNASIIGPETLQIAFYKPGQHYTWHPDSSFLLNNPIMRKLTVIAMLSESNEYTGGNLEIEEVGEIKMEKGDVLVFPSWLRHRVTPVEEGLRKTAVTWISGYRSL